MDPNLTYRVQGTGESQRGGDTAHDDGNQVVQVTECRLVDLQGLHADVVQGFVVDTESLVRVFDKLVDGERSVVRLNDGVGDLSIASVLIPPTDSARTNLGGRNDGESAHHSIGELLSDLGDQERTHTGTGTTTEGVGDLETLQTVDSFGFFSDDIEDRVDEFGTFSVMALGPVVTSTGLTKDAVEGVSARRTHQKVPRTHKLSGLKRLPRGPALMLSIVPGSKSTKTARGTYF